MDASSLNSLLCSIHIEFGAGRLFATVPDCAASSSQPPLNWHMLHTIHYARTAQLDGALTIRVDKAASEYRAIYVSLSAQPTDMGDSRIQDLPALCCTTATVEDHG